MGIIDKIFARKSDSTPASYRERSGVRFDVVEALGNPLTAGHNYLELFCSIPEVFWPIDYISSRIAGANYQLKKVKDDSIVWDSKEFNLLTTKPNCMMSWRELVYNHHVYKLATGNAYMRAAFGEGLSPTSIFRFCSNYWELPSDKVDIEVKRRNVPLFGIAKKEELVDCYRLNFGLNAVIPIPINQVWHDRDGYIQFESDRFFKSKSRMASCLKAVSNLIAVYEARNVIYVKRGGLGFLISQKKDETGTVALTDAEKKTIREEHMKTYGIGTNQMPYGLSDVPLGFVRTNLSIKELEPFEETLMDSITISSIYGIPAVLVPRKDQSTFSNQATAEKSVYSSSVIPLTKQFCKDLTAFLGYEDYGYYIDCDFSDVDCLQVGLKDAADVKKSVNDRCQTQFSCGIITLNDWRANIGESKVDNPLFDKLKFDMSEDELNIIDRVFNTKSEVENGRKSTEPSVQD